MAKHYETPMMVTVSRVKEYISGKHEMRTAGDFAEGLNESVAALVDAAVKRCKNNNRGTVRTGDL